MRKIVVIERQSLLDIAVQEYGRADAVFILALTNNLDVTDSVDPGQYLLLPVFYNSDKELVKYFADRQQKIATSYPYLQMEEEEFAGLPGMLPMMLS